MRSAARWSCAAASRAQARMPASPRRTRRRAGSAGWASDSRLIVRGELGHTFTDDAGRAAAEPALLRRRRPQHPRLRVARGRPAHRPASMARRYGLGARNVVTASVEYEHYFNDTWGARGVRRQRQRVRRHAPTGAPASAWACAGARRWGRCAWTSRTGWTTRIRPSSCTSTSAPTCELRRRRAVQARARAAALALRRRIDRR